MSKPNVLFIVWDTARASTVHAKSDAGRLPTVSRLCEDGVQFRNAMSTAPWTLPSHASLFTGQYTESHRTHFNSVQFDPDVRVLPECLRSAGYETAGISSNVWISPEFGFDRGFDHFSMKWNPFWNTVDLTSVVKKSDPRSQIRELLNVATPRELPKALTTALYSKLLVNDADDGARRITSRTIKWIRGRKQQDDPFFFFLNYLEPHLEYDPPDKYWEEHLPADVSVERAAAVNQDPWKYLAGVVEMDDDDFRILEALYRAEITHLDGQLDRLLTALDRMDVLDDTMIVVVGDHGENIGEHGFMDHQYCLYNTLLHVPLMVRYPPRFERGRVVTDVVETRDIYPTILDVAGVDVPESDPVSTRSLAAEHEPGRGTALAQYVTPQPSMDDLRARVGSIPDSVLKYDRALRCVQTSDWKLIEASDGEYELYDMTVDGDETTDRAESHPEVVRELGRTLRERFGDLSKPVRREVSISETSQERLRDMGYL